MIGFILAAIYFAIELYGREMTLATSLDHATNALWYWYIITAVIMLFVGSAQIGLLSIFTGNRGRSIGAVALGLFLGLWALRYTLLLTATYLLSGSYSNPDWNIPKLVFAGVFFFIGFLMSGPKITHTRSSRRRSF